MTSDASEPEAEDRKPDSTSSAGHPNQPGSDEADKWKQTTPAGIASELEEKAEDLGASTEPDAGDQPSQ
jgi:hypothetical protein